MIRVDKLVVTVRDGAAMARFYQAMLGVELRERELGGERLWLGTCGEVELWLVPRGLTEMSGRGAVARWVVPDVAAAVGRGIDAGGVPLGEVEVIGDRVFAALLDPDGHPVELVGPPASRHS